jgi:hypothetical protein
MGKGRRDAEKHRCGSRQCDDALLHDEKPSFFRMRDGGNLSDFAVSRCPMFNV